MGDFAVVRPEDDSTAKQASSWCNEMIADFGSKGHRKVDDVNELSPADNPRTRRALRTSCDLICYFGHGSNGAWLESGMDLIDSVDISDAKGRAVVSIACKTGRDLGPDAITAGVITWLGFTIKVPVVPVHKTRDPFGEAIVEALGELSDGNSMQDAADKLYDNLGRLADDFDTGSLAGHPSKKVGYFAAIALRDHIALHGTAGHKPL